MYNDGTKRTEYSTVPTSDITAEVVTVDGFALSQKVTAGITGSAGRSYTASGMMFTQTDGRSNTSTTVTDILSERIQARFLPAGRRALARRWVHLHARSIAREIHGCAVSEIAPACLPDRRAGQ